MIRTQYIYKHLEDWPDCTDADQPARPMITVDSTKLVKVGNNEDPDSEETYDLQITLKYGCSHTKFPNAGPWGKWYCGERNCLHYLGRKGTSR